MTDIQLNGAGLVTTSAAGTAPAAGTVETWSVTALDATWRALGPGETITVADGTSGATAGQQAELIRVTASDGPGDTSITVVRGVDGTTPVAHSNPATFYSIIAAGAAQPPFAHTGWAAALANLRANKADVVMFGDSLIEGYGLTAWDATLPAQLAKILRGSTGGRGFIGAQTDMTDQPFWPIALFGAASVGLGYGPNARYFSLPSTGSLVIDTVPAEGLTSFDLHYFKYSGGAAAGMYYKIDGGAAVTFNTFNATFVNAVLHVTQPVQYTIEVGYIGAAGSFIGITEYNGDENAGLQVHNCGYSGTEAAGWNTYASTGWAASMAMLNPDLMILDIGTNDARVAGGNRTPAQFKTNLLALIANLRASVSAPLALIAPYDTTNDALNSPLIQYIQVLRDVEAADPTITLVDCYSKMPAAAATDTYGLFNASALPHASTKGYALMAEIIAQGIAPGQRMSPVAAVSADGPYDIGRALRVFRSTLGGSTAAPTDVLVMGASFEEGYGTTLMTNAWPYVFRDVLRVFAQPKGIAGGGAVAASSTNPPQGVGNYFAENPLGMYTGGADGVYPDSPVVASSGTLAATTAVGLGLRGIAAQAVATTRTYEWFGTGADFVYSTDPTFGSFTWAVDGGSATTVNTAVTASQGNRVQIRGLTRGRHTLQVTQTVAGTGGSVVWEGVAFYDGDESSGIRVWSAGKGATGAKDYVSGTGQTAWVNSIQSWNLPSLVIFNMPYNDWNLGRTSAQFKTDMLAIITALKARCNTLSSGFVPSIVLLSPFAATPLSGTSAVEPYSNFLAKVKEIAAADDAVCYLDLQPLYGRAGETNASTRGGFTIADGVHATNGGAAIIGGAVAEFVLGSSERMRDLKRWGTANVDAVHNASVSTPGAGFASDTYLAGSDCLIPFLPASRLKAKTKYRCRFHVSKTGAGVATPIITVRTGTGTAGAVGDTSRAVLTFAAQTAVIDDGWVEITVIFRTVGSGTVAVIQVTGILDHSLAATGLSTANTSIKSAVSSGFDSTTATVIGLSVNGGASAAWTIDAVESELMNLA